MESSRTVIKPPAGFAINLKELWRYRELLYFFTWRDLKVKYKQTVLGVLWAILQPLGLMLLFTLVFSKTSIAQQRPGIPYELFVLSGLILWNLFHSAVSQASDSMITNASIISKIYFPRLILPVSALLTAFIDFLIAFVIFLSFCFFYKHPVSWTAIIFFPAAVVLCLLAAFGTGMLLGALNVKYRDFRYALPFLLQALFFSTQIIYPAAMVQQRWIRYLFALNPVNTVVELFRIPILQTHADSNLIFIGTLSCLFIASFGLFYFKKTEAYFADII